MNEQWQELKETIIELRDNDGTQQEVCKFLAIYMDILEKQIQEPCEVEATKLQQAYNKGFDDCRQAVLDINAHHHGQMPNHVNHEIWKEIKALPPVTPQAKEQDPERGHWINYKDEHQCSRCRETVIAEKNVWEDDPYDYCPKCGRRMESEEI